MITETANDRRNRIAQELLAQQLAQQVVIDPPPHSPTSSFDFAEDFSPAASTAAIGVFDPAGSSPTMQGGAPTATDRQAFDNSLVQDWGSFISPDPTMTNSPSPMFGRSQAMDEGQTPPSSPSDIPSFTNPDYNPFSTPEFNPGQGLPAAPSEQGASLSDPGGGALGALGLGDLGSLADGSAAADNTGGSEGVG